MTSRLTLLLSTLEDLTSKELKKFRLYLSGETLEGFARMPRGKLQEDSDATDVASQMAEMYGVENSLKIALHILREINHNELAARLEEELERTRTVAGPMSQLDASTNENENTIKKKISEQNKARLRRKFEKLFEGTEEQENHKYLNEVYIDLCITEGGSEEFTRHEVQHIEIQSRVDVANESVIKCNDIFHCSPGHRHIRTVITKGVAGIGKTVTVQKFILDWAEGRANQDIDFIFMLPFRELNLVTHDQYTLLKLLLDFHPEMRDVVDENLYYESKIVFIFDGLDESKLPLNFLENKNFSDVREATSVDMLITNLIRENFLPSAYIWITSRPAAASQIPSEYVDRWTEIKGFDNQQKEQYFKTKIRNPMEADQVVTQIKKSKILYVMCHIPIFCWILATVLQRVLSEDNRKVPQTLTEIFIHFLLIQMKRKNQKYNRIERDQKKLWESNKDVILKYAELGFKQLDKGNILFTEEDLADCGIDFNEDLEKSGICTAIFIEEVLMQKKRVFCFIHLSVQEFLAAVFVLHSFAGRNMKALEHHHIHGEKLHHMLVSAVKMSLQCRNGQFDLFLRFLLGISLESNQKLLHGLVTPTESTSDSISITARNIKNILSSGLFSAERCMNLLLCLLEMKDNSLEREIQQYVESGATLSPDQCSVLAYVLLMSEDIQDEFDLGKYKTTNNGRERLIVALGVYRKARLVCCDLTLAACECIKSVLQAENSPLRELDLSGNSLRQDEMQLLCGGLTHRNCKLKTLRMVGCGFTYTSYNTLASALRLQHSQLKELDLSNNPSLKGTGVEELCSALIHSDCKLEKLGLAYCDLTYSSCTILASVIKSTTSWLRDLDLSNNDLWDYGVGILSSAIDHPNCKMETLRLSGCLVSERGCEFLASALRSNPSHLTELDLSYNHPGDTGVQVLSELLEDKKYKLEKLNVDYNDKCWMKAGLQKYGCQLTLDPDTANPYLSLSKGNKKATRSREKHSYPDHPERFEEFVQVLGTEGLTRRCYWEADLTGIVRTGMTYKNISRKGEDSQIGCNDSSWSIKVKTFNALKTDHLLNLYCERIGVYLDWTAGMLSFYVVNQHELIHQRTFYAEFTKPLYPGFELLYHEIQDSSVSLQ